MVPTGQDDQPTDEAGSQLVRDASAEAAKEQPRSFLAKARRELDERELSSPAARRFFIAEIERLDKENAELRHYRDSYFEAQTQLSVMRESRKVVGRRNPTIITLWHAAKALDVPTFKLLEEVRLSTKGAEAPARKRATRARKSKA
jgi:hypothetical protein